MRLSLLVFCCVLAVPIGAKVLTQDTANDIDDDLHEIDSQPLPMTNEDVTEDESKAEAQIDTNSESLSPIDTADESLGEESDDVKFDGGIMKESNDLAAIAKRTKGPSFQDIHKCSLPLGMEDGRISNIAISASSSVDNKHRPQRARLNTLPDKTGVGAWVAKLKNANQWIQVNLGEVMRVSRVTTQGRAEARQFVKLYTISYSIDGSHWTDYRVNSITKMFTGNNDQNSPQSHNIVPPIDARYIRLNPKSWESYIAMRFELFGCRRVHSCAVPVGMQDDRIPDSSLTASSSLSSAFLPKYGRLNKAATAWIPKVQNNKQWFKIDLSDIMSITRCTTQGRYNVAQYVTSYYLSSSLDGSHWAPYKQYSQEKLFAGNVDGNTVVEHVLNPRIEARYVMFKPMTWKSYIALRVELYGCRAGGNCKMPLGVEDGRVSDAAMTSTAAHSGGYVASKGRLNAKSTWIAKVNNANQHIAVDFGAVHRITSVNTQGRYDADQWIKSFTVSYSVDGTHWVYVKKNSAIRTFPGNNDRHTPARNYFKPTVFARMIRLHPKTWHGHISMRLEYYGCPAYGAHQQCWSPLGIEDGRLPNNAFSASTEHNANLKAYRCRLNDASAWIPKSNTAHEWLQVDLGRPTTITKIACQGRPNANQWVESFYVSYSLDMNHWAKYHLSDGTIKRFGGNANRHSLVFNHFSPVINARGVRVHPLTWTGFIAIRIELYGCHIVSNCMTSLGVEDGRVPAANMKASSLANPTNFQASRGRLFLPKQGAKEGGWCSQKNDANQWLQIQFDGPMAITKVAVQGRAGADSWVKSFKIMYSFDGTAWALYKQDSVPVVFPGNFDRNTVVEHHISPVIYAKTIRFHPVSYRGHMCMRVEVYGCSAQGIGQMAVTGK